MLRHVAQQALHVAYDGRAICLIIVSKDVDQCRKRAWPLDALPDVAADVIEAEIAALFDAHHDDFAVHFRGSDRRAARHDGRIGNRASGLRTALFRHWLLP